MKVTVICEVLGVANNGTSVAAYNLINSLRSKGHEVTVVCPDQERKGQEGWVVLPKANVGPILGRVFEKNNVIIPRYDEEILREAIQDADVVHIMIALFISRKTSKLVKSLGKPLTAGFHAQAENFSAHIGFLHNEMVNHLIYKWYDKNIFCRADAIHYPTQFIRDIFEKEVGRKTNGYVISNGVSSLFKPNPVEKPEALKDKFCILYTGRLSVEKCHSVLVCAVMQSKYKDRIQLIFAGNGPKQRAIEKLGSTLPNPPIIKFYPREELLGVINFSDLYCHPAEAEIEAISCLEAISGGLVPVIADSPKCATKQFAVDERCLFKVNDSSDLAKKLDYFIDHPEEKTKLRERYLNECKTFEQNHCMDMMERMLLETAGIVERS